MADEPKQTKAESSNKPANPSSDKGGNAKSERGGAVGQELVSTLFNAAPWAAGGGLLGALGGFLFTDDAANES